MARFTASVEVAAPAPRVWAALVDWPAHGRWTPLTRIRVTSPSAAGVGARFAARTGVGPLAFDDPMEVTRWEPPTASGAGHCTVVKRGSVVRGSAWFDVVPIAPGRSRVEWTEDVDVAPSVLSGPLAPAWAPAARWMFARALRRMAVEVESDGEGPAGD